MSKLVKRWKAETPDFWKKVQKIGIGIGAVGGVIVGLPVALPAAVVTIGGYMVAVGSVAAVLSKLTVKDPSVLEDAVNDQITDSVTQTKL
jgi:hypothetical protein